MAKNAMTTTTGGGGTVENMDDAEGGDNGMSLMKKYASVVIALEKLESKLRMKHHPTLIERALPLEVDDIKDQEQEREKEELKKEEELEEETEAANEKDRTNAATAFATINDSNEMSLRRMHLEGTITISKQIIPPPIHSSSKFNFEMITSLDVSHNELTEIPGIASLTNLRILNLNRNWFNTLPSEIGSLTELEQLIASRNFLRPNTDSLRFDALVQLHKLQLLDLQYNQKCGRTFHRDRVKEALSILPPVHPSATTTITLPAPAQSVQILMTLWEEIGEVQGTYVGTSAAVRDPVLLRSQLEPLGTVALRRRLVCDFGQKPTDPTQVDRKGVMRLLLKAYHDERMAYFVLPSSSDGQVVDNGDNKMDYDSLIADRTTLKLDGIPVPQTKIDELMIELRKWTSQTGHLNKNRERPSINASNYMILRKPKPIEEMNLEENTRDKKSRRAIRKAKKLEIYRSIWELGIDALRQVDPIFANTKCTEIAVTYGFKGSPHRDKQNCGPFYGLSMGNFTSQHGGGCVSVESSARLCVQMNTHNRLGKVDGRFVHWVTPWINENDNINCPNNTLQTIERYSLIYYETGNDYIKPGPAVFTIPNTEYIEEKI